MFATAALALPRRPLLYSMDRGCNQWLVPVRTWRSLRWGGLTGAKPEAARRLEFLRSRRWTDISKRPRPALGQTTVFHDVKLGVNGQAVSNCALPAGRY
jgi:hypothetical protein